MSHSCDATYDVYDESRLTARKAHECDACDLPIRPGDGYWRIFYRFEGRAEHVKRCLRCQVIHEHLRTLAPGEMWPAEKLDCGEEYRQHWDCDPPEWIADLAFWSPGESLPAIERCFPRIEGRYQDVQCFVSPPAWGGSAWGGRCAPRVVSWECMTSWMNDSHQEACS